MTQRGMQTIVDSSISVKPLTEPFCLGRGTQDSEDPAGQIALDAAPNLLIGLTFGTKFLDVVSRFRIIGHSVDRGHTKCAVESSIATPIQLLPVRTGIVRQEPLDETI